jgi:hypothetical protein
MKRIDWMQLSRHSRLGRVMYPHLAAPEDQREMEEMSRNERRKSPLAAHQEQLKGNQGKKWWSR